MHRYLVIYNRACMNGAVITNFDSTYTSNVSVNPIEISYDNVMTNHRIRLNHIVITNHCIIANYSVSSDEITFPKFCIGVDSCRRMN